LPNGLHTLQADSGGQPSPVSVITAPRSRSAAPVAYIEVIANEILKSGLLRTLTDCVYDLTATLTRVMSYPGADLRQYAYRNQAQKVSKARTRVSHQVAVPPISGRIPVT